MCYHTKLDSKLSEIEKEMDARFIDPDDYKPMKHINGYSHIATPVITDSNQGEIEMFNWGLIPFWAKDDKIKKKTLNARIETVDTKPSFRNSIKNRCLVIANGYYEWQWLDSKGKEKQKYLLEPKDQKIFAFAGIYSSWNNPETKEEIYSYSIITTDANELMSVIHNNKQRMPVVLKKGDHARWLSGDNIEKFAFPYDVELNATKVV